MSEALPKESVHAWSIVLAALLFLLGDKSLLIARLGLRLYDGQPSSDAAEFEIALVGLAIGTAAVLLLSVWFREVAKQDAIAIVTGLLLSTISALLNIVEAAWLEVPLSNLQVITQAMFFYALWALLFLIPFCASSLMNRGVDGRTLKLIATIACALVLATATGALFRAFSGWYLLTVFETSASGGREGAFDKLQYEPDVLIMLGATWIAATFLPRSGLVWRVAYVFAAPVFGYCYGLILSTGEFHRCVAYAAMSTAAIWPWFLISPFNSWPNSKRLGAIFLTTSIACAAAMHLGFSILEANSAYENVALSILQGLAGALSVGCAVIAIKFSSWQLNWSPFDLPGG